MHKGHPHSVHKVQIEHCSATLIRNLGLFYGHIHTNKMITYLLLLCYIVIKLKV